VLQHYHYAPPPALGQRIEALHQSFIAAMVEDFTQRQPALVFIDNCVQPFNNDSSNPNRIPEGYLEHYLAYPAFHAVWDHYRYLATEITDACSFGVYVRKE
jgi:hypothetical protein